MTILNQKYWLLLMHSDISLMHFDVLLNAFGCVLITSDYN